jgi:hypothetical protein
MNATITLRLGNWGGSEVDVDVENGTAQTASVEGLAAGHVAEMGFDRFAWLGSAFAPLVIDRIVLPHVNSVLPLVSDCECYQMPAHHNLSQLRSIKTVRPTRLIWV